MGLGMSVAALLTACFNEMWPFAAIFVVSAVYGATAIGWNGVYLSKVARIAPPGKAAAATGASLAMTYAGVVALPIMFWAIVMLSGSYAAAYVAAACLTLWRASYFFRADRRDRAVSRRPI